MKYLLVSLSILTLATAGCKSVPKANTEPRAEQKPFSIEFSTKTFHPFYVFSGLNNKEGHFAPAGWMGDTADIKFAGSYQENPNDAKTCLRITYLARGPKGWAAIYWQQAANNWGDKKGGYDLRGASKISFYARGERGGEKISEFKMGGITGKFPDSDVAWIGPVKLSKQWKEYSIPLAGKDLRYVNGGFCFTVLKLDNPDGCTFYLGEIRYE